MFSILCKLKNVVALMVTFKDFLAWILNPCQMCQITHASCDKQAITDKGFFEYLLKSH